MRNISFTVATVLVMTILVSGCFYSNTSIGSDDLHYDADAIVQLDETERSFSNIEYIEGEEVAGVFDTPEEYIDYLSQLSGANFYYSVRFSPEKVPGMFEDSLENLKAMYYELDERFDFALLHWQQPFYYTGHYEGEIKFVPEPTGLPQNELVNQQIVYKNGSVETITPINRIKMGRTMYQRFNNKILNGRNFVEADFYITSPEQAISVVLGYEYIDIYEIGDIIQLNLFWQDLNFVVIGFYEEGTGINIGQRDVFFDSSIIMPAISIGYEPFDKNNYAFQAIYYSAMTEGNIRINEPINEVNDDTHTKYEAIVLEMANRHNLKGAYSVNFVPEPVGVLAD